MAFEIFSAPAKELCPLMDCYKVTPKMNNARFEDPEAVEKYGPGESASTK